VGWVRGGMTNPPAAALPSAAAQVRSMPFGPRHRNSALDRAGEETVVWVGAGCAVNGRIAAHSASREARVPGTSERSSTSNRSTMGAMSGSMRARSYVDVEKHGVWNERLPVSGKSLGTEPVCIQDSRTLVGKVNSSVLKQLSEPCTVFFRVAKDR